jgi:hypothetical protein
MKIQFNKTFVALLVFTHLQTISLPSWGVVWQNQGSWSSANELEFQQWVRTQWHKNFFANRYDSQGNLNPYYGILNDCADTVYTMRLVFAYESRLPFEINDPTGGKTHISNTMSRWDREPSEINRVRSFINYIHNIVSTHSLPNDTYPVPISKEGIVSGGLLMTGRQNHHSWTIKDLLSIGVPHLIFNSVVRSKSSPILQERKTWPNPHWLFEGMGSDLSRAGFRYWKPINQLEIPGPLLPQASLEQYRIPLKSWVETIQKRLATESETAEGGISRVLEAACDGMQNRIGVVAEALEAKKVNTSNCMSDLDFDNYSSPSRDHRIFDDLIALRELFSDAQANNKPITGSMMQKLSKLFPDLTRSAHTEAIRSPVLPNDENSVCLITYGRGKTIDLAEAKRRMFLGQLSSNPNLTLGQRWGEANPALDKGSACLSQPLWKPFE